MSEIKPRVKIILLCYNHGNYIEDAVNSVLKQKYKNVDVLISDDCSTDNTVATIDRLISSYHGDINVSVNINSVNMGLVGHINYLFSAFSLGDYVALCSGDDIMLPWRISESIKLATLFPSASCVVLEKVDFTDHPPYVKPHYLNPNYSVYSIEEFYMGRKVPFYGAASRLMKSSVVTSFKPLNDDSLTEDSTYFLRSLIMGDVIYSDVPGILYRIHDESMTSERFKRCHDRSVIFQQYLDDAIYAVRVGLLAEKVGKILINYIKKEASKNVVVYRYYKGNFGFMRFILSEVSLREKVFAVKNIVRQIGINFLGQM